MNTWGLFGCRDLSISLPQCLLWGLAHGRRPEILIKSVADDWDHLG